MTVNVNLYMANGSNCTVLVYVLFVETPASSSTSPECTTGYRAYVAVRVLILVPVQVLCT